MRDASCCHQSSSCCHCLHQGTYDLEDTSTQKDIRCETSHSGMVPLRWMQDRQPTCAADAHTKQMDHRSSFGSAIPQWWRGANTLLSTLRRNTGRNRRVGDSNGDDKNNNDDGQQLHKYKYHILCRFFCDSCCAAEATQRYANSWNINMIFMD